MIIGNFDSLMVHMDKFYIPGSESNDLPDTDCPHRIPLGVFHFIINYEFHPKYMRGMSDELESITNCLKENLIEGKKLLTSECTYSLEEYSQFVQEQYYAAQHTEEYTHEEYINVFDRHDYCLIDLSYGCGLEETGFTFALGFLGDEDRFFYTDDYGKENGGIYKEVRYPRGTVENLIMSLPDAQDLELVLESEYNDIYRTYAKTAHKKRSFRKFRKQNKTKNRI